MICLPEITEASIRERLEIDKKKPSRLATWAEIEYLLDLLTEERRRNMVEAKVLKDVVEAVQAHHNSAAAGHLGMFDLCPHEPCRSVTAALPYESKLWLGVMAMRVPESPQAR